MRSSSSFGSGSSRRSNYSRTFDFPEESRDYGVAGSMLPMFLNDLRQNNQQELVEVTLELDDDDSIVVCSVTPTSNSNLAVAGEEAAVNGILAWSLSAKSRVCRKFSWLRSLSTGMQSEDADELPDSGSARDARKVKAKLDRTRSSARRALKGLRFISNTTGKSDELWNKVESRFESLSKDGLLCREDFGECIGMVDSKEFAVGIFDALARRSRQRLGKITKEELYNFWLQISDPSFDARLQIFFDMWDSLSLKSQFVLSSTLSASANKLSKLKERAEEYASLIMEELDPENLGYIEIWQLETLLLQRDTYMNYSRPLSTASVGWSQNLSALRPTSLVRNVSCTLKCLILDNWQRGWILLLWFMAMAGLFAWKFNQYREMAAFEVMGYCLTTAKGAAETLKLNMALILLPVCRNMLTWLRSTRARHFIPFDDNINFHKELVDSGAHDSAGVGKTGLEFFAIIHPCNKKFATIATDFNSIHPTYKDLLKGVEGVTGIYATRHFRKNIVKLPAPFNRLTGFNAFWYSHHLFTWMYISVPLFLYVAERSLRTCRSEHYSVRILKVSVLPGDVFSLIASKPNGFKYKSGQYIFLQCPTISPFEWHPFSITSAPGDDYLSVHIRTVGDWTQELKRVFTEDVGSASAIGRAKFGQLGNMDRRGMPKLLVDGPYGAPAQDYKNYDVLLLVGLGIGATPFISILRDLLNNTRTEDQMDSNTEATSRSDDSFTSFTSSNMTSSEKKKLQRTTNAHFYWVTREPGSFEWFKGVMNEVAEMDHKGQIEMHNYLTSVYEEGDARSTLITMVQVSQSCQTWVRTHFARPNWREVFNKIASKYPYATVGVFYCGMPLLAKELKKLSHELTHRTSTRFEFHKEYF
ncbi:hypothetical protein LOK49_LG04G00045 [Camellia lanceoleosa]|uniref:Uncharacterized protein n=1 Tax=Camellia lanceoleosa TaxID=1840588 RepID=A0ACC0I5Y9_9ERIC|nr:hypothetical protein LOK49_LG04G00045 [Camellia lanceoleosa]